MERALKLIILLASVLAFGLVSAPQNANSQETSVGNLFIDLYNNNDKKGMEELIKSRTSEVSSEVAEMVEYAMGPDSSKDEQDFLINIAGTMAQLYKQVTGDERLLNAVQQNFSTLIERRKASFLPQDKVNDVKKKLEKLGKGAWKVRSLKMVSGQGLLIDIDIRDSSSGGNFAPSVDFKTSQKAKGIVNKELPDVKEGKISWSSMGVGLKIVFLNQ